MSLTKRQHKEIKSSLESDQFEFFYDEDGIFGDKHACYIRFWINQGAFEKQVHIIEIRFIWGSNVVYKFPKNPPACSFLTPMFHTNISTGGSICLDVIKSEKWSPMYSLETIYNSIVALLEDPNHSSPFNGTASSACKKHSPEEYQKMTMEYYLKHIKDPKYARALPLIHADCFSSKSTDLNNRAAYVMMLDDAL